MQALLQQLAGTFLPGSHCIAEHRIDVRVTGESSRNGWPMQVWEVEKGFVNLRLCVFNIAQFMIMQHELSCQPK